jgi:rhodanese-related sulfurtransferase
MKNLAINPRILLSVIIVSLGLIIAAVPKNTTTPFKLTAQQILDELKSGTQYLDADMVAKMIVDKDPVLQLIDVRPQSEFEKYSLPGAINIPLDNLLSTEFQDVLNQDMMTNVFYANGSTRANEAWMLVRQLGYENNYVLMGGLNYWFETIMNPQKPASTTSDDELAKYDFRMGASQALGGGGLVASTPAKESVGASVPKPKAQGKKKAVKGGCS